MDFGMVRRAMAIVRDSERDIMVSTMEERSRRSRKSTQQSELQLGGGANDRGRFQDVVPTIYDGADLDIPTFVRRGIRLPS